MHLASRLPLQLQSSSLVHSEFGSHVFRSYVKAHL